MGNALRVCSWNIHLGMELDRILEALSANVAFRAIDLLLLQEASSGPAGEHSAILAEALGPSYQSHHRHVDQYHGKVRALGAIWNTDRIAVDTLDVIGLPLPKHANLSRIHRRSLSTLRLRRRVALMLAGTLDGRAIRTYNVHLSPVGFQLQVDQLQTILRHEAHAGDSELTIVAGDFNSLRMDLRRWSAFFDHLRHQGYHDLTRDVAWTFRTFRSTSFAYRQKLDNILARSSTPLRHEATCPDVAGSDHLPLFATVQW